MKEEKRYWYPELETMPLNKLRKYQEERLKEVVAHAYEKSAFYRRKYDEAGVKPGDIETIDDIKRLPLILDAEYRSAPISERITHPLSETKVVCSSAGTTGMPDILPRDERSWEECKKEVKRYCWGRGVRPGDVVQILHGFECIRWGYEQIGATTLLIHAGRGILDNQIGLAKAMNVTVIEHVPTLAIQYLERAKELGVDTRGLKVVCTGEGFSEAYKKKLEAKYGISFLYEIWGATELRTAAIECDERNGFHILEDHIIEVIDPETQQVLGVGQDGELVATSLVIDSTPMIRWRSGDVGSLLPYVPCPCGRTLPKISSPIRGRIAFSVKVKGKRIFPIDVEQVIASVPGLGFEYQIIADKPRELEKLRVKAEVETEVKDVATLKKETEAALSRELGVESEVKLVPVGSIGHTLFKAQKIVAA